MLLQSTHIKPEFQLDALCFDDVTSLFTVNFSLKSFFFAFTITTPISNYSEKIEQTREDTRNERIALVNPLDK